MKIGGFWGLSAPMLIILSKSVGTDKTKGMISMINKHVNQDIIDDLRTELVYLYNASDKFPRSFSSKMLPQKTVTKIPYLSVKKGKLAGLRPADDEEELRRDLISEITIKVAITIVKELYAGNSHFNLPIGATDKETRNNFVKIVNDYVQDKSFRMNGIWSICKEIVDSLREDTSNFTDRVLLCRAFSVDVGFHSNINVNGVQLSFNEDEMRIIEYVLDQEVILDLLKNLDIFRYDELVVFDTPFRELICRNPASLLYLIIDKFDLVKTKRHGSFLINLVSDLKRDLALFRTYFQDEVVVAERGAVADASILTSNTYNEIIGQWDRGKHLYFSNLLKDGCVKASDLRVEDLSTLSSIYDYIVTLSKDNLNALFDVNYDNLEWDALSRKLCDVGICGINLHSKQLLKDAIRTTSFVSVTKFEMSRKNVDAFKSIIDDIDALLNTIKPIGEAL